MPQIVKAKLVTAWGEHDIEGTISESVVGEVFVLSAPVTFKNADLGEDVTFGVGSKITLDMVHFV